MMDVRADRQWLTAAEAAAEQLPGFEFTEQHIRRFLAAGHIKTRKRSGRGGGREFHWSDLPSEARATYLKRYGIAAVEPGAGLKDRDLEAEARAAIVARASSFIAERHLPRAKGLKQFCAAFAHRKAGLDPWIYEALPKLCPHNIANWQRKLSTGGTSALVDGRGRPKGSSWIEDDLPLKQFIVARRLENPHFTALKIAKAVAAQLGRDDFWIEERKTARRLRTLQAFLADLKNNNRAIHTAFENPDRGKSHFEPAFGSLSMNLTRPNQLWEIDATRADAMCRLPDGTAKRFALTAIIDVFTRRARVLVSDQPRGLATQALLRRAIADFGLPETLKADNGKEYRNRAVERFCRDTGIALEFSKPFSPTEKGHVERFFGTILHDLFEMLPGYVAHDIAGRKAIENRRSFAHRFGEEAQLVAQTNLSPGELQARIDAWLTEIYEQREHSGLKPAGTTPAMKAAAHEAAVRHLPNPRALDVLLFDCPDNHGIRVVGKRGVRVGNVFYIAPELGEFMGQRVHVKLDPLDPAVAIVYRADRLEFLCVARDAEALDGESRMRIAVAAQGVQRKLFSRVRADVRAVQRAHPAENIGDSIIQLAARRNALGAVAQRIEQQPSKLSAEGSNPSGATISLGAASERAMLDASRPALIEHARAQAAVEQSKSVPLPIPVTDEEREGALAFLDSIAPRAVAVQMAQCDGYQRPSFIDDDVGFYRWALAHRDILDTGDREELARLNASHTFQLQLANQEARDRAIA